MLRIIKTQTGDETRITYQLEKPEWGWFVVGMVAGFLCYPVWSFLHAALRYY